ncbi:MAG TPA: M81 family metallopeptidase [Solimonas sp.]|nr:M81 family metallopeptidase [Solimonas sp.]
MKIFAATLATETNTFTAVPTSKIDFESNGFYRGDGGTRGADGIGVYHAELRKLAAQDGHTVVESISAFAQPAGTTLRAVYEEYRAMILDDLRAALPVDAVQLILHGAMVAQGYDDCEGDLCAAVREIVGPDVPIGMELDLHCHFTELMRRSADFIICYKEYPHIDGLDRLRELYALTMRQAAGEIRAVTEVHDCRMLGMWHTTKEPMKSFVARMQALEGKDGVLSVSLGHGFPRGDVADVGARLWVITDNDAPKAAALARRLGEEFWALRDRSSQPLLSVDEAVARAKACMSKPLAGGPLVLADTGDNPGGGAMGDSNVLLRAMLDAGVGDFAIGSYWDLGAVALCRSAGVGATLDLRIGGKCGPLSGDPVDLRVTVRAIVDDHAQFGLGTRYPLGTGVWVQTGNGIDIALITHRAQVLATGAFEGLGIELARKKVVVVKSSQHFYATFSPIAGDVQWVATPGSTAQDFRNVPFTKRDGNYWPRVENPWAA